MYSRRGSAQGGTAACQEEETARTKAGEIKKQPTELKMHGSR